MAVSAILLAELVPGVEKAAIPARDLEVVEGFCSRLTMLPYPLEVAYHFVSIRAWL